MTQFFRKVLAGLGIGKAADAVPAPAQGEPVSAPPPPSEPAPDVDATPDVPQPFGYKINWFAVRAAEPGDVLDALGLTPAASANWASGMAAAYLRGRADAETKWVFASPPVDGWVLLVGFSLPYPVYTPGRHDGIGPAFDAALARLKSRFDEVLFFGSYRVVDFVAWARARRGEPDRVFAYGDGEVYANIGRQSPEEAQLGFPCLDGLSLPDATDRIMALLEEQQARQESLTAAGMPLREAIAKALDGKANASPGEDDVIALAGLWSVDPTRLDDPERTPTPGTGLVARLPDNFMRMPE